MGYKWLDGLFNLFMSRVRKFVVHTGLVSVIITTFGRGLDMLSQAVESVQNQTYKKIEIIIVDDNGIGSELQKVNACILGAKGVRYIPNDKNYGVQFSRNRGLLEAQGEYVAFLDDDDVWVSEKIEKQIYMMKSHNVDMVFCNGYRFRGDNFDKVQLYQKNFISNQLISYNMELESDYIGSTSHPLIRRECFARAGLFDLEMPARQDYEMWLRICKHYKVQGINEPLFYYRYHDGVRITKSYDKELLSYKLLLTKYRKDYNHNKKAKAGIQISLAVTDLKAKRYGKAILWGTRSFFNSPRTIIGLVNNHIRHKAQF